MKNKLNRREIMKHEVSPAKSLLSDLVTLRRTVRDAGRAYVGRLEAEIDEIATWTTERARERNLPKARIRDLGDMITIVRKLDGKAGKGRRRDLKRLDSTIEDLRELIGRKDSR
jgi:hypothetical protein